jgi:chromosome segregation ATPase
MSNGSDFANELFSPEENRRFSTLLNQLRSFEAAVSRTIRQIENQIKIKPNVELEGMLEIANERISALNAELNERHALLESDMDIAQGKILDLEILTKELDIKLGEIDYDMLDVSKLNEKYDELHSYWLSCQRKMEDLSESAINVEERIATLEEQVSSVQGFIWDSNIGSFESSNPPQAGSFESSDANREENNPNDNGEEISRTNSPYSEDSLGNINLK